MLAHAARDNNNEAVRLMLEAEWPPDARGQHNGTALHWACFHGNAAMARDLLRHGAPVNVKGEEYNATPLGWARHGSVHGWYSKTGDYEGRSRPFSRLAVPSPEDWPRRLVELKLGRT